MRSKFSKVLALAMAAVLAVGVSPAVTAQAASKKVTLDKQVIYLTSKTGTYGTSFTVEGVGKLTTKPKSSKKSVVKVNSFATTTGKSKYTYHSFNGDEWKSNDPVTTKLDQVNISVSALKKGTATVTFTGNDTDYSKVIEVKKYSNPIKSFTVTNLNGGKNLADKFAKSSYVYDSKDVASKGGKVKFTVVPKAGWEVTYMYLENYYPSESAQAGYNEVYRSYYNGTSKGTVTLADYDETVTGYATVGLRNKADGGTLYMHITIYPEKAATN